MTHHNVTGLSPDTSPKLARKAIGNAVAAAVAANSPAETTAAVVAAAAAKFGSEDNDSLQGGGGDGDTGGGSGINNRDKYDVENGLQTFRSGLTICSWERTDDEIEAEKKLLTGVPNLGRWLNEFFL